MQHRGTAPSAFAVGVLRSVKNRNGKKPKWQEIEMSKENALGGEALVDIASVGRVVDHRSMLPLVEPR